MFGDGERCLCSNPYKEAIPMISAIFQTETTALQAQVAALQARIALLNETELLAGGSLEYL